MVNKSTGSSSGQRRPMNRLDCHSLGSEPFPGLGAVLEARGQGAPESQGWPDDAVGSPDQSIQPLVNWRDGEGIWLHQHRGERVLEKQAALFDPERYERRPQGQLGNGGLKW